MPQTTIWIGIQLWGPMRCKTTFEGISNKTTPSHSLTVSLRDSGILDDALVRNRLGVSLAGHGRTGYSLLIWSWVMPVSLMIVDVSTPETLLRSSDIQKKPSCLSAGASRRANSYATHSENGKQEKIGLSYHPMLLLDGPRYILPLAVDKRRAVKETVIFDRGCPGFNILFVQVVLSFVMGGR